MDTTIHALLGGAAIALCACAGTALARDGGDFAECRAIADPGKRLACYDGLADAPVASAPRQTAPVDPVATFGLPQHRVREETNTPAITIEAKVVRTSNDGAGGMDVRLDNGQVWKITSNSRLRQWLRAGDEVQISEGTFSGYRIRARGIKGMETVRRVD